MKIIISILRVIEAFPLEEKISVLISVSLISSFLLLCFMKLHDDEKKKEVLVSNKKRTIGLIISLLLLFCVVFFQFFSNFITNYTSNSIYDSVLQGKGNDSSDVGELLGEYENKKPVDIKNISYGYGWGNTGAPRKMYSLNEINSGILGESIVFNSISDGIIGDERGFVGVKEDNTNNRWSSEVTVEEGKEYLVRLYVHNDNPKGLNAIARDTTLHFTFPLEKGKNLALQGSIDSSNANPKRYWYIIGFKSDRDFVLDYIEGSAFLENSDDVNGERRSLSDDIIASKGIKVGYDSLDGNVPGGYKYALYIGIKVKPIFK